MGFTPRQIFLRTLVAASITSLLVGVPNFADGPEDESIKFEEEVDTPGNDRDWMKEYPAKVRKILESAALPVPESATPVKRRSARSFIPVEVKITDAPIMGDARAKVTLIEYSDYQCPYCARHFRQTMPKIIEHYIDRGKVKFVLREFPIPNLQPRAAEASQAALCAGSQGEYWKMHNILLMNQTEMSDDDLRAYAAEIGLDASRFSNCLEQEHYAGQIEQDIEEGIGMGVRATPSFAVVFTNPGDPDRIAVINLIYGARNFDYFAKEIDELLAVTGEAETTADHSPAGHDQR
jgi:protein-disulfide isomerase